MESSSSIFTHVMWDMYWAPPGFCFDTTCDDAPMVVNPSSPEYNVYERVGKMVEYLENQVCGGLLRWRGRECTGR